MAIESSVGLADLWVKDGNFLWWWDSITLRSGGIITIKLNKLDDGLSWYWWGWVLMGKVT